MNQNDVTFKCIYEYIARNKTIEQSKSTRQIYHAEGCLWHNFSKSRHIW